MKEEKMAKRSSFGSIVRKKLSDITNSLPQPKSPGHNEKPSPTASSTKDNIDHLLKLKQENMALMRLIADKNKIVELSGIELQRLRVNLQKMQLQNWNLAQSNSHIVAELNLGKEKLKTLQHELVCKDALLKAKNLEFKGQLKMNDQKNGSQEGDEAVMENTSADNKPCNGRRRRPIRSQSMGPSTTDQQVGEKERVENKRRCLRRQSARFKSHQQEVEEKLFEIEDTKFPVVKPIDSPMHEDGPTPLDSSTRKEEKDEKCAPRLEPRESQRTSLGRPMRKATEKVQSYKEIPLNIKMRRAE